jgi:putative hydrolase of the HAD superfamily
VITVIGFDGDDTLWHNESIFSVTQERFRDLLRGYVDDQALEERLLATEMANLRIFGYGVKGFTLSMIETAIEVSNGLVSASEIQTIIGYGKEMLSHPVELLERVPETIDRLSSRYRLMLITKGDLFDQESKIARSGLAEHFWKIEIVSEKDERTYRRILELHDISPAEFVMVGNSIKSDVLPVVATGCSAVLIPYHTTWVHERVDVDIAGDARIVTVERFDQLPATLANFPNSHLRS